MKKKNKCLNVMKGIGCIGVVFIHVQFPGEFGKVAFLLARYAVPLFFMISGYYAYGACQDKLKCRMKKIIRILFFALFPYVICIFRPRRALCTEV